jgi:excisionase family DNA binding protein
MHEMQREAQESPLGHLLTTSEVQRLIKVDRSTVYRMAEDGRLPAVKVGRQWRFPEDRLHDWLQRRLPPSPRPEGAAPAPVIFPPRALQPAAEFMGLSLGTMVVLTDLEGRPLCAPGNPCGLFEALHAYPGVLERCALGWQELAAEADLAPQWRTTPLGFLCARSLVRNGDRLVATVLAGGVAPAVWPPTPEQTARLSADLGVPPAAFSAHASQVYRLAPTDMQRVLDLLPRAAAFLSRLLAPEAPLAANTQSPAADPFQRSET